MRWGEGAETTKNLETLTQICLYIIQFSGAAMMIKGSLLRSVPIVKRFKPKNGRCACAVSRDTAHAQHAMGQKQSKIWKP